MAIGKYDCEEINLLGKKEDGHRFDSLARSDVDPIDGYGASITATVK